MTEVADLDARGHDAQSRRIETDAATQPGPGMVCVPFEEVLPPLTSVGAPQLEATGLQLQRRVLLIDEQ